MTTSLHSDYAPSATPNQSMTAMSPSGQGHPAPPTPGLPKEGAVPRSPASAQPGPASSKDEVLLDLLVHMSLRMRLRGVDLESSTGLHGRELDLVAMLTSGGPTSVKHLVADLGLPRSTMTAIVDRLQERGLVVRHPNPGDRRSVILEATEKAEEALRRYHEGMLGLVAHIKRVLPPQEQDEFTRLVHKMADTF